MQLSRCPIVKLVLSLVFFTAVYTVEELENVKGTVEERQKELLVDQNTYFTVSFNQAISESETIEPIAQNPSVVVYPKYISIQENSSGFIVNVACVQAGNCPFTLNSLSSNSSSISNLDSLGFTMSCLKYEWLIYVSSVVGWAYFFVWSFAFYPQYYIIVKERSVEGFSFSYLILNTFGQISHTVYNALLYFNSKVQTEFFEQNPQSQIPLKLNDVCYSVHALFFCIISFPLFLIFRSTYNQKVELWVKIAVSSFVVYWTCLTVLWLLGVVDLINYLIFFSYVKLAVTVFKYIPQITLNYRRKSTRGFSITAANCDLTGCVLSFTQSLLVAFNNDDWATLWLNPTKNLLALVGIVLDSVYNWQHFILYGDKYKKIKEEKLMQSVIGETWIQMTLTFEK